MNPASITLLGPLRNRARYICPNCQRQRQFSQTAPFASGHSKWATTKHDKARTDAAKGRQRSVHSKEIAEAVKHGGPDPTFNARLTLALATAKKGGFPRASIEQAIARGQGRSTSGAALENLIIEAVVPPVALIIDCQTDSKARALQEIRLLLKNHGATQTPTAYLFSKRGRIKFQAKEGVGLEEVFGSALEAGALDVTVDEEDKVVVDTEVEMIKTAEEMIVREHGLEVQNSETIWVPKEDTMVESVEAEVLEHLDGLREGLEEYGVNGVYINADLIGLAAEAQARAEVEAAKRQSNDVE